MKSLLSFNVMVPSKSVKKMNLGSLKGNLSALRSMAAILSELEVRYMCMLSCDIKMYVYTQK